MERRRPSLRPTYESHKIDGNQVTLKFSETGSGLVAQHSDQIQGFAVSGKDGQWHCADAKITSANTITLTSKEVDQPQHIRYAYAANRTWANLFNKEGLPALSFTTEK